MVDWTTRKFVERLGIFLVANLVLAFVFAGIYRGIQEYNGDFENLTEPFDYFYFSWITQSTIGYGDHSPKTELGKVAVCAQSFTFWMVALSFAVLADEEKPSFILDITKNWNVPYSEFKKLAQKPI